jgi:hypothetical protein
VTSGHLLKRPYQYLGIDMLAYIDALPANGEASCSQETHGLSRHMDGVGDFANATVGLSHGLQTDIALAAAASSVRAGVAG